MVERGGRDFVRRSGLGTSGEDVATRRALLTRAG